MQEPQLPPKQLLQQTHIYVFEPQLSQAFKTKVDKGIFLSNEFSKTDSIQEIAQVLNSCGATSEIIPISLDNYVSIIENLSAKANIVVFNLCDGTEIDG